MSWLSVVKSVDLVLLAVFALYATAISVQQLLINFIDVD